MRIITDVKFRLPGQETNLDDKQWAGLSLKFTSDDDHYREVDLSLLVSNAPTASLLELHGASRDDAIETLRAALAALEQYDLSSLAELAAANDREDQERRDERNNAELSAKLAGSITPS